ncbi:DUF4347 domain-containing protein [Bordetella genomosp. 12]|nr:DUF4347 domain-containing protein [Bordetella genomosp. 12]
MKMVKQWLARRMSKGISPRPGVAGSPLLMALEPRVVYDASVAAVAAQPPGAEPAAGVAHHSDPLADPALKDPGSPPSGSAAPDRAADATPPAVVQHAGRPAGNDGTQAGEKSQQAEAPAAGLSSQVVFIDPSIGNYQALIDGLPAGTQYVLLDASTDGFAQIAQYLTSHQGIESISLLSHGEDGAIQAGSAWLTAASLESFRAQLTQIGAAMKPGGDFLIYGCDVAQQADGQWLVQQIADISHLNVAASIDDTGAAALGGDWTLEYEVGAVHPTLNDPAGAYAEFDGLLGVIPTVRDPWLPSIDIGGGGVTWTSADAGAGTGGQPIVVAPGLVMSDSNGYNLISVTVQISGGFQAGDVLSCTDEGGVSVTFNTSSGILSIEGDSGVSVDRLQSVLRSVTFSSTGAGLTSSGATRTISFSFNDGYDSSNVATQTISLVASRQSPVLVESGASSSVYVLGNGGAPVVDSIHISDADDTTLQSATVKITSGLQPGDLLVLSGAVVGESGLTTTYQTNSGNLTLTANGALSLEQWQTVLSAVQFMAGSSNAAGTRTISFSVNDGERNSKEVVYSIDVISAAPAIGSSSSGSVAFVSADNPASSSVVVDPSLTVTSVSNSVTSATIAITGNLHTGEDVLSFINDGSTMGDIRSLYNTLTGVLTLSSDGGIATLAQWQAALRAVTYTDTAITPNTATRTISFTVSDGSTSSAAVTRDVTVSLAEQSPVLVSGNGSVASFVAADNGPSPGIAVDDSIVVSDYDSSTLLSATVTIGAGFQQSEDILGFTPNPITMGNILAVYNNATGVLALISADGSATLAQWQAALRSVTYTNVAVTPNTATRTISFTVSDGSTWSQALSRDVAVSATDQTPILSSGNSGAASFVAGNNAPSTAVAVDDGIVVSDLDSSTLVSATVTIGAGFQPGEDTLSFANDGVTMGNIEASYNAFTGVLSLSSAGGSATLAQWQTALRAVTYTDKAATPNTATRTISFTVDDGIKTSSTLTRDVTVTATDQAPIISSGNSGSASFVAGDNSAGAPMVIDDQITVTDRDSSTLGWASVSIGAGFRSGEDFLSFVNDGATMGSILGVYNASTGVLSLTSAGGTATLAQWQAALRSVKYIDAAATPTTATRTISFTVSDGSNTSTALTRDVTVTATDQTPVIRSGSSGSASFVSGDNAQSTPIVVDGGIVLSDLDNTTLGSASVIVGSGFQPGEDVLGFVNDGATMGNISASYNAFTGVLTLTSAGGTATLAQWQAALRSVTYTDTAVTPNAATRTISFTVNDGVKTSTALTRDVTVTATNQTPVIGSANSDSTSFVAGDNAPSAPVVVDNGIVLSDMDDATLAFATVAIGAGFAPGEDSLGFVNDGATMGNISGSYNAATGVLTLNSAGGTATLAQWQAALRSVTYSDTVTIPSTVTRAIAFQVSDGTGISAAHMRDVTVTATDQAPVLSLSSNGSVSFVAGDNAPGTPVVIDAGITVIDLDNISLYSATVRIDGNFHSGEDSLGFAYRDTMGNISASYDAVTGVLTLTSADGTATLAQWQAALRAVTYSNSLVTDTATRTISITVNDGIKSSAPVTRDIAISVPEQTPQLSTSNSGSTSFVAGDNSAAAPIVIDDQITVTDRDSSTLQWALVTIRAGFRPGEDILSFVNDGATMGSIMGIYNAAAGELMLTSADGTATLAQWQAALRSVTYTDTAATPTTATRTVSFAVSDGVKTSTAVTRDVTVTATDQTPVISSGSSGSASFVSGDNAQSTPIVVDGGIVLSDLDNATLNTATVQIGTGFQSGEDVLGFVPNASTMGNITGSYNAATGVLTLISAGGTATLAQWQSALRSVTYTDTAVTPNAATRTISFTVNDGVKTSTALTRDVTVTATDQTPIISSGNRGSVSFVSGDNALSTPIVVDGGIVLSDLDNATLASATVSIGSGFQPGEDVLGFVNDGVTMGNIAASYNAFTGVLTLSSAGGTATLAQWQAALRSVTYTDTAVTPDAATRTISFTVDDGVKTSTAVTRDVTVTVTDQTPIISSGNSGSVSFVSGDNAQSTPIVVDGGIVLSDLDNATLASATVSIGSGFQWGEDVLSFVNNGATMGNIVGSYNAATGVLTLTSAGGTATLAQWQAALRSVTYTDTAVTPDAATRTISFTVDDGIKTSTALTRDVTVTTTDQTPIISSGNSGSASFVSGDNVQSTPIVVDNGIVLSDLDNATLNTATVQIGAGFQPGEDVLGFVNDGATMGNITASYNAFTGVLTLTSAGGTATLAQWQAALRSVTYTDTAVTPDAATRTISFTVDDGIKTSTALTRDVTVTATDQTPIISSGNSGSASFVSGDNAQSTPVVVDDGIVLSDLDNTTLASATVSIGSGFQSGEDVLSFVNNGATMGNIIGSYNAATGVLTLTSAGGTASLAQWQAALRSVTYTDTAVTPSGAARSVLFVINDGQKSSATLLRDVAITATHQTPLLSDDGRAVIYTADGKVSSAVLVGAGITLTDLNATPPTSATVAFAGQFDALHDVLGLLADAATGDIVARYDAARGVLTLTSASGTASLAQWQAALAALTYRDTQAESVAAARTLVFTVSNGDRTSAVLSRTVQVVAGTSPVGVPILGAAGMQAAIPGAVSGPDGQRALNTTDIDGRYDPVSSPIIVMDAHEQGLGIGTILPPVLYTFSVEGARDNRLGQTQVPALGALMADHVVSPPRSETMPRAEVRPLRETDNGFALSIASLLRAPQARADAVSVSVSLADGARLPAWLHFDAELGMLTGKPPVGLNEVRLLLIGTDAAGNTVSREIIVKLDGSGVNAVPAQRPQAGASSAPPPGKSSLATQFANALAMLHVSRDHVAHGDLPHVQHVAATPNEHRS